ncbi:MAG TPA: proton-conducting transporter membrane subunit, partial [Chloroflexota bacterium]
LLPVTYWAFLFGALANVGFPLTAGFFSKDEIVFSAFASERGSQVLGGMALLSVVFTGFYVFRAFFLAFHGQPRVAAQHSGESSVISHQSAHHVHAPGAAMNLPVALLGLLSLVGGGLSILPVSKLFDGFLEPVFHQYAKPVELLAGSEPMQESLMLTSVLLGIAGILVALWMYVLRPGMALEVGSWYPRLYRLLLNKYYVDEAYGLLVIRPALWVGRFFSDLFDPAATDGLIGLVAGTVRWFAGAFRSLQSGYLRDYALAVLAGAVVLVGYLVQAGGMR